MKNLLSLFLSLALFFGLCSCDSLEQTDKVRSEPITVINGDTLIYEMYLTGLKKFRYEYNLISNGDTTLVFETKFEDSDGNEARMEIEEMQNGVRIMLDKPIENQQKTINGTEFELRGTK